MIMIGRLFIYLKQELSLGTFELLFITYFYCFITCLIYFITSFYYFKKHLELVMKPVL